MSNELDPSNEQVGVGWHAPEVSTSVEDAKVAAQKFLTPEQWVDLSHGEGKGKGLIFNGNESPIDLMQSYPDFLRMAGLHEWGDKAREVDGGKFYDINNGTLVRLEVPAQKQPGRNSLYEFHFSAAPMSRGLTDALDTLGYKQNGLPVFMSNGETFADPKEQENWNNLRQKAKETYEEK